MWVGTVVEAEATVGTSKAVAISARGSCDRKQVEGKRGGPQTRHHSSHHNIPFSGNRSKLDRDRMRPVTASQAFTQ
jgi:hypothetical protein